MLADMGTSEADSTGRKKFWRAQSPSWTSRHQSRAGDELVEAVVADLCARQGVPAGSVDQLIRCGEVATMVAANLCVWQRIPTRSLHDIEES